jgi:hypothetical protein
MIRTMTQRSLVALALVVSCGCFAAEDQNALDGSSQQNDQGPAPKLGAFVIYAQRSLHLTADEKVDGNSGVHAAALGVNGSQLFAGSNSHISKLLVAPSVEISEGVTYGGALTNQLVVAGSPSAAQPFPAVNMPALPFLPVPPAAGTTPVSIKAGQSETLKPGTYGALTVAQSGRLRLLSGEFVFSQVTLDQSAELIADIGSASNPKDSVTIKVLGRFTAMGAVTIRPVTAQNLLVSAEHLTIFVYGGDSQTDKDRGVGPDTASAYLGSKSDVTALLAAPHGTLLVASGVTATGAFAAYDISVEESTTITFQDGFPSSWGEQTGSQQLQGYLPTHPGSWPIVGPVPLGTPLTLSIGLPVVTPQGFPALKDFIKQVSDPKQPATFRHFLSQADFKTRYGASDADYQALLNWAASNGLSTKTFSNNLLLSVSGTAGLFEQALHVFLLFRQRADGSSFVSVDRNPSLNLSAPILQIGGLDSFVVPQAGIVTVNGTGLGGGGQPSSYRPADLLNAYLSGPGCSNLTGNGQVVGLVEVANFNAKDISLFDSRNNITPVSPTTPVQEGGNPPANGQAEANLDVSMVQGLAPGAVILVFQGSTGITGHLDTIYHTMATWSPPLTVASSSLFFKASKNEQQALDQLAAQGVSFFQASGDFGDIGDPQDNTRMDNQTLVGGTFLSTNNLNASTPPYPNPYYKNETAWNQNQPKTQDATGGGIMNGHVERGVCYFCAGQVNIPDYQIATQQQSAGLNKGSTSARNYPDVAGLGGNFEDFVGLSPSLNFGTSVAAPMWAGFTALANELQDKNNFGNTMGFLNPTLYDIGQTSGTADDLYSETFNDVNDNSTNANGWGPGFLAVNGYDLVAGWGTPTCNLLTQLASPFPLTDTTPLVDLEFIIGTGDDGLESYSQVSANVLLPDGVTTLPVALHPQNSGKWKNYDADNGGKPRVIGGFEVPKSDPQITRVSPIKSVTITLIQHNSPPHTADNWDMTSLTVNAYTGNSQRVCQIQLTGNSKLDDGSTGLFRFKKNFDPDCSTGLCGPSHTFSDGCP